MTSRRDFLKHSGLFAAALPALSSLTLAGSGLELWTMNGPEGPIWNPDQVSSADPARWDRTLVLIELKGGNDGLNTVVPIENDTYYRSRPRIAIAKKDAVKLDAETGLHPSLAPLGELWKQGELAIVQGVGYEDPNRSHFRSIEIWETGSDSDEYRQSGWLEQLFRELPRPEQFCCDGISLGRSELGPLAGDNFRALSIEDPARFVERAREVKPLGGGAKKSGLEHILDVRKRIRTSAQAIEARLKKTAAPTGFSRQNFGRQLATAAHIIGSKIPVLAVRVTLTGFDTHTNQAGQHRRLLEQLGQGLKAFELALKQYGAWNRTLCLTYSEFGRRVSQNGSAGTDHGTAAPHFALGGRVKGGLYGKLPSLTNLDRGDLRYTVDYRSLYATCARDWWQLERVPAELKPYSPLKLLQGETL